MKARAIVRFWVTVAGRTFVVYAPDMTTALARLFRGLPMGTFPVTTGPFTMNDGPLPEATLVTDQTNGPWLMKRSTHRRLVLGWS